MLRRHAKDLGAGRHVVAHPGDPVEPEPEAHLLEHVAVVVDAGLVQSDPEPRRRPPGSGSRARCRCGGGDSSWDWADLAPPARDQVDVPLGEPHAVPERQARAQQAQPVEVLRRRASGAPARVLALVGVSTRCMCIPAWCRASSLRAPSGRHRSTSAGWRARAGCALARRGSGRAPPRGSGTGRADRLSGIAWPARKRADVGRELRRQPAGRTPGRPRTRARFWSRSMIEYETRMPMSR